MSSAGDAKSSQALPPRPGEVGRNVAIARRAADVLGFCAEVELEAGLAATVEWFRRTAVPAGRMRG